jgi:hypothetical protein
MLMQEYENISKKSPQKIFKKKNMGEGGGAK